MNKSAETISVFLRIRLLAGRVLDICSKYIPYFNIFNDPRYLCYSGYSEINVQL
jgi:hypothetical protein